MGLTEGLPCARRQHEHSMAVIQEEPVRLKPGEIAERGFFGWFEANHPEATSANDLVFVDEAMGLPEAVAPMRPKCGMQAQSREQVCSAPPRLLKAQDLTEAEITDLFGGGAA